MYKLVRILNLKLCSIAPPRTICGRDLRSNLHAVRLVHTTPAARVRLMSQRLQRDNQSIRARDPHFGCGSCYRPEALWLEVNVVALPMFTLNLIIRNN